MNIVARCKCGKVFWFSNFDICPDCYKKINREKELKKLDEKYGDIECKFCKRTNFFTKQYKDYEPYYCAWCGAILRTGEFDKNYIVIESEIKETFLYLINLLEKFTDFKRVGELLINGNAYYQAMERREI